MDVLLKLPIIDGPVPWIVWGLALAAAVALILRRVTLRWAVAAGLGVALGIAVAVGAYLVSNLTKAFGDDLPLPVLWWTMATLGAVGLAVASFARARVWRRIVAGIGILLFALSGVIGVNAFYGLNPTVGSLFGDIAATPIALPTPTRTAAAPTQPLYETWKAPAGMPATGRQGTQAIPGTVSGFVARDAGIYLPPAALVPNAPALPLVIMMMGFPGNPDPSYIGSVMDAYAAKNDGLAPIVIVADQLGTVNDPACADSAAYGNAETYINTDVVAWARANLNVIDDPRYWVVAGYSNGGGCAIKYGALHPDVWKNIVDVSGEPFPGSEDPATVTTQVYGGDSAKFEAAKPVAIMQQNSGQYDGVTAAFTAGANDPTYLAAMQTVSDAAKAAGMTVSTSTIPGAGHTGDALTTGLTDAFAVMFPVLGLSAK